MARLPSAADMQRRAAPTGTPAISAPRIDYGPEGQAAATLGQGVKAVAAGVSAFAEAQQKRDSSELDRRLLDFKLQTELDLVERSRTMPEGGAGFTDTWRESYRERAAEFVGEKYQNIPQPLRSEIDTKLTQHEVMLHERAQRGEWTERDRKTEADLEVTLGRTRDAIAANPDRMDELHAEGKRLIDGAVMMPDKKRALAQKYRQTIEEAAAMSIAGGVRDAESYRKARDLLAPYKGEKQTKEAVKAGVGGPASVRYNNPGAMYPGPSARKFGSTRTEVIGGGHKIAVFDDPVAGAAAQFDLLSRQYTGQTLLSAISKWSGGNSVGTYLSVIERETGMKADDVLTKEAMADPAIAVPLARAMSVQEAGRKYPLSDEQWQAAHTWATSGVRPDGAGSATVPIGTTEPAEAYAGPFQNLSMAKRQAIFATAEAAWEKQRTGIKALITEHETAAANGRLPNQDHLSALEGRIRAMDDPELTARYATMLRHAETSSRLMKAPPIAIEAYRARLEEHARTVGSSKEIEADIEHAKKIEAGIKKDVNENPMSLAQRVGIVVPMADGPPGDLEPRMRAQWQMPVAAVKLEPLNFGAPDIDGVLAHRIDQAKGVGRYYGQAPQVFTQNEREFLRDTMRKGGDTMAGMLGKISQAATRAGLDPMVVMREFSKDAPEVAIVGEMVANRADPAIIKTATTAIAWRTKLGEKFVSTIDKAQATPTLGEYADVLASRPTYADAVRQTANIVYEYEARKAGKEAFDQTLYQTVVKRVMGETVMPDGTAYGGVGRQGTGWNDGKWASGWGGVRKVLVPPDVRQDSFDDMVGAILAKDLDLDPPLDANGKRVPIGAVRAAEWVSDTNGVYALVLGRDAQNRPLMARHADGSPYAIDVRPLLPAIQRRKPSIFRGYDGFSRGVAEVDAVENPVPPTVSPTMDAAQVSP